VSLVVTCDCGVVNVDELEHARALLIGVVSGTYSSIFNASQLLVSWYEWDASRRARRSSGSRAVRPLSR
jgi:preprotein translocase subunit SecF